MSVSVIGITTATPAAAAADIDVTLASDGSTTQVATTDPAQTVYAHFTVARGQHLILFCEVATVDGVEARVIDSAGRTVPLDDEVGCFHHVMGEPGINTEAVQADGPLTLVLPPYHGKTFSAKLSYRVFDDVHLHAPVDGSPITFTPTFKGQDAFITFDAKPRDRIYATCTQLVPNHVVTGDLLDPDGNPVPTAGESDTWGWCDNGELFRFTPTLYRTGTYTLRLHNEWQSDAGATVTLAKTLPTVVKVAPPDGTPFTLTTTGAGQNARALIGVHPNEHVLITCTARADQPVVTSTYLYSPVFLGIPAEPRLCRSAATSGGFALMDSEWNWREGTSTLEIDPDDAETGTFDLRTYVVTDPQAAVPGWDRPASVTTTKPGQNAKFTFQAVAGAKVSGTCQVAGATAKTKVVSPSGVVVATGTCETALLAPTSLPESGTYSAIVDWPGLGTNTATATFHLN